MQLNLKELRLSNFKEIMNQAQKKWISNNVAARLQILYTQPSVTPRKVQV